MVENFNFQRRLVDEERDIAITNEKESHQVCDRLITRNLSALEGVFYHSETNIALVNRFISAELFPSGQVRELVHSTEPTAYIWIHKFLEHIRNNPRPADCLNLLCNLKDDRLRNYEIKFCEIFSETEGVKLEDIEENSDNESDLPQPLLHQEKVEASNQKCVTQLPEHIELQEKKSHNNSSKVDENCNNKKSEETSPLRKHEDRTETDKTENPEAEGWCVKVCKMAHSRKGICACIALTGLFLVPTISIVAAAIGSSRDIRDTTLVPSGNDGGIGGSHSEPEDSINPALREPSSSIYVQQIYARHPSDITGRLEDMCNPEFNTTLVIDAIDPFDWHEFNLDCGSRIRNLALKGHLSLKKVHEILNQTDRITHLKLEGGELCLRSSGMTEMDIESWGGVTLSHLHTLKLAGIEDPESNCKELLTLFARKISFQKIKSFHIGNAAITKKNKFEIRRMIINAQNSIRELHFTNINLQTTTFDLNFPRLNLSSFHFYVKNVDSSNAYESLGNFLGKANVVQEFRANVEIPEEYMSPTLSNLKRIRVQDLVMIVKLNASRTNLSFRFLKNFRRLTRCELNLTLSENLTQNVPILFHNFELIRPKLGQLKILTNFAFRDVGASSLPCRLYEKSKYSLVLNKCEMCSIDGCLNR